VEKLTDAEIRASKDKFHGFDIDKFVSSVASINMFIESHGTVFPNIVFRDSLAKGAIVPYDVILANMPFGVKGLTYKRCHESVKALHLDGTKSEPLFLQWMMVSLNLGGRCAVVVPDGMNVNNSKCHNETRKYLLDHFELKRVIKMKGQFFMNTGIQPSILFFENTGKPTTTIEFWDTEKNADGTIKEDLILSVVRTAMDETHSFDMRHYQTVDIVENSAGFPMVKLGDIAFNKSYPSHDTSYGLESGSHIFHTGGENTKLYINTPDIHDTIVIINRTNGHGKCNIFIDSMCSVAKQTIVLSCENINTTKYMYYWMKLNTHIIEKGYIGSNHKNISKEFVRYIELPLPPLPIQEKIVEDLDLIYQNADFAKKSANFVKRQMAAVMRSVSARGFERKKLGDVCSVAFGERITQKNNTGTIYPVYGSGGDTFRTDSYNRTGKTCKLGRFAISEVNMVMFIEGPYWLMDSGFTVESKIKDILQTEFLWYLLLCDKRRLSEVSTGSCQKNIEMERFYQLEYPIPPLPIQAETLAIMNEMEAELKMLEQMAAKAEARARFILDGYLSTSATEDAEEEEAEPPSTTLIHEPLSLTLTHESPIPLTKPDYNAMSKPELLEQCKNNNIKGVSNKKKEELIKVLEAL
jgi:restriction endonuclease S subunit